MFFTSKIPARLQRISPDFLALAADWQHRDKQQTLFVISPDYLAPSFGYYFAAHPIRYHSLARWEHPEIMTYQNYVQDWASPTLVIDAEQCIQEAAREGYKQLAFIYEARTDRGRVKYSQAAELFSRLKRNYPLLEAPKKYPGIAESVVLYLFSLTELAPNQEF